MDETGLRVEMTALPSCTLAILLTLARENHGGILAFPARERADEGLGIRVAISPGTRSSEACKEKLEHETE